MAQLIYTTATILAILAALFAVTHGHIVNALWLSACAVVFAVAAADSHNNPSW